ncbi:hypothetical protein BDW74DRAFT_188995 [Aspergillus multicolor]|uniref:putative ferric-chelate reductase (Fre2) n=1 Tax=Aspergillus multicolor TaxID=41759 RepID=UPI003CCD93FF
MAYSTLHSLCGLLLLVQSTQCMTTGRAGHGFVGYGISMYKPPCAYACRAALSNPLNCTTTDGNSHGSSHMEMDMEGMEMGDGWMIMASPSAECYATNDAFLQTLGLCISAHCTSQIIYAIEKYWQLNVPGTMPDQPLPKQTYQEALRAINGTPPLITNSSAPLLSVGHIPEESYLVEYRTLSVFEKIEISHETYGLVFLLIGAIIPIACSLLRFLPIPATWTARLTSALIDPPLIGSRHKVPLANTFLMPTRGQALFIFYQVAINIILCAVSFESANPSTWYISDSREILTYVSNRTGVLAFANIPLLVLYSSRNNVLLWVTNWSHGTFLLLHRWIAFIAVLEACIHSAIYLHIYVVDGDHTSESKLPYWFWGIVATLSMVVILPASTLPVRQRAYEVFLAWHILFFLLSMIGCFLHIYYRYAWQWGYENWIYTAFAIWGFDRLLRILRVARHGILRARVTVLDEDYVKLEILGVRAEGHIYLYFPTLSWRVWENHPFSVIAGSVPLPLPQTGPGASDEILQSIRPTAKPKDAEATVLDVSSPSSTSPGTPPSTGRLGTMHVPFTTLYIRTQRGVTSRLRHPGLTPLPVLLESSYPPVSLVRPKLSTESENILAFVGGVGITAIAPLLLSHTGSHRLFWGVRSKALLESVRQLIHLDKLDTQVFLTRRMDISGILEGEVERFREGVSTGGYGGVVNVTVVVCGPPSMADEVTRETLRVSGAIKRNGERVVLRLVEESFSW